MELTNKYRKKYLASDIFLMYNLWKQEKSCLIINMYYSRSQAKRKKVRNISLIYIAKKCKNHEFLCKNAYLCDKNEHNE